MTFQSPWWLLLLLVPVAVVAAYVVVQRSRKRAIVRFTSVDLLASVAPRRPGWQRHVSAIGMVAALTALALALAGPAMMKRVALDRATIVLTLDTSASMMSTDIAPTRLAAAQTEARDFVDGLPEGLEVGLVSFSTQAQTVVSPTSDYSRLVAGINGLQVGAGTATGAGIDEALAQIKAQPPSASGKPVPAAIVLMSDGSPTVGTGDQSATDAAFAAAAQAKAANVPIYTIALGTPDGTVQVQGQTVAVPYDPTTMAQLAEQSGGTTFTAESAAQLKGVYDRIGRAVAYEQRPTDLTPLFTGVGLAFAVAACCAALYWNQRVV